MRHMNTNFSNANKITANAKLENGKFQGFGDAQSNINRYHHL